MLYAQVRSKLLLTGCELKVFNHLSRPTSADAVAQAIGGHEQNTRVLLDGLAACDLVLKKNGLYQNAPVAQTFLVEGSPTYLGLLILTAQIEQAALDDMTRLVKEGPPPPSSQADSDIEEVWTQFHVSMANIQRAGMAQRMAQIVAELPEFPSFGKMLDLGGGPGLVGVAIVAAHPSMKGVIFDLPALAKLAESSIKEYDMEDRLEVLGGDYNKDPIGGGYDLILAKNSLYFAGDALGSLMRKVYEALNPGGVFISHHEGLTHERTKPGDAVIQLVSTMLMGQDVGFSQGVIADSMIRVGFKSVRSRTMDTPIGPMDLDIGRKG
jgi:SAM-dependent methyltransferase